MIYTVTLNPSVDYKIETDNFEIGTLNRVSNTSFFPGGKGINVSRVLNNLGIPSTALGFLGGFTGDFIKNELNKEGVGNDFVNCALPTRINIKLKANDVETEINGTGTPISEEEQKALIEKIANLSSEDYLVLSGSLPASLPFDFYEKLAEHARKTGARLVIDTSGPKLKDLLKYKPFFVKPNHIELSEILEKDLPTIEHIVDGAKTLVELGASHVIISMGGDGAIFVNENEAYFAKAPKGDVISTIGAGDSLVAGFLASIIKTSNSLMAFQYGVASGSATAFSLDLCDKQSVEELFTQIEIKKL